MLIVIIALFSFISEANVTRPEADYKFKYVYKGPRCARNKQLFYVTGTGLPVGKLQSVCLYFESLS